MSGKEQEIILLDEGEQTRKDKGKKKEKKNVGGRPLGSIWLHFERKDVVSPGRFGAECKYCSKSWK